jgi:tetratricopeptide (TPR) repeat protein
MGTVILKTRDAASAASYFQKAVDAKPQEVKGHYALGIAYFASGDYTKSQKEMEGVVNNPETAGGAEYFLGRIAREQNNLDDAGRHLHRSIELMPDFSESHTELARVYMLEKRMEAARTELDRALKLDPDSFQANLQLLVLYRRNHDVAAVKQAEIVKKLDEERSRRAELMLRTIEVRP